MSTAYIAWQDDSSRRWFPIGKLSFDGRKYRFVYVAGAVEAFKKHSFPGLHSFPNANLAYESNELFPVFANRLLSPTRPEFGEFVEWMGIGDSSKDPVALLARSGGIRETDTLQVYTRPERSYDGAYEIQFFVHGIRYQQGAPEKVENLKPGDKLELVREDDNQYDNLALKVLGDDTHLGYCPRYLAPDLRELIESNCIPNVTVKKINPAPVPIQYRLLCHLTACWPEGFQPFRESDYEELLESRDQIVFSKLAS